MDSWDLRILSRLLRIVANTLLSYYSCVIEVIGSGS